MACQKEEEPTFCTCDLYTYQLVTLFNPVRTEWVLQNQQPYSTNCQDDNTKWQEGTKRYEIKCKKQ